MSSNKNNEERKGQQLSLFDLGTSVVHITASDGEVFVIHESLLDYYGNCWGYPLEKLDGPASDDISRYQDDFQTKYHYRGLVHWLYHQELPSDDLIRQSGHPEHWNEGKEKEPLACSMAFELYPFAWCMEMGKLVDDIVTYLFSQYMTQGIPPSLSHLSYVFREDFVGQPLIQFCVDIYCKLNSDDSYMDYMQTTNNASYDCDTDEYPKVFLFAAFKRQNLTNFQKRQSTQAMQVAASTDASFNSPDTVLPSQSTNVGPWIMKLRDYHIHMDVCGSGWVPDVNRCECSTRKEHYIIE